MVVKFISFIFIFSASLINNAYAQSMQVSNGIVLITGGGEYSLDKNNLYKRVVIHSSDVVLNCNGAKISGEYENDYGVIISGEGKGIKNIKISDCDISKFNKSGVMIASGIPRVSIKTIVDKNSRLIVSNIIILKSKIYGSKQVGVFVDAFSTKIRIVNSEVYNNGNVGVYFEEGSSNNEVSMSIIKNNGHRNSKNLREGIAIDSSTMNIITKNVIDGNGAGGVFLYKNCGEYYHKQHTLRYQHSDANHIQGNRISNEKVGIWLASRQSRDLSSWDCGDKPVTADGKYFMDYANKNLVEENKFCDNKVDVIDEGSNNDVVNNKTNGSLPDSFVFPKDEVYEKTGVKISAGKMIGNTFTKCNDNN